MIPKSVYFQDVEIRIIEKNPFAHLAPLYREAAEESKALSHEERLRDWIHTKRSNSGSNTPKEKVTYVLPVTGALIQI